MQKFAEHVVVITGGAGGIGLATAAYFLERDAKVAIVDVDATLLARAADAFAVYGDAFFGIQESVAAWSGAQRIMERVNERFGMVSVLLNNAAIVRDHSLLRMTAEEFDAVIGTNLSGTFYMTKAVLPSMVARQQGRIINMIAASGLAGNPGQTNYAASKGGIMAMTLTWSKELKKHNIMVNAVIPAAWTAMSEGIPEEVLLKVLGEAQLRRMQARTPDQVAPLLGYLASPASNAVTGQCLSIAGEQLSIWQYGKPFIDFEAPSGAWTLEEIEQRLATDNVCQHPAPSLI